MNISTIDIVVFSAYCLLILFIGLYVSREKKGKVKSAEDYFLAGKSLPWWAIGAKVPSNLKRSLPKYPNHG